MPIRGVSTQSLSDTYLKLDQTTPQTITGGIPLLTGLTPTTDYQIATKKYVDDAVGVENLWDRTGTTLSPHTAGDSVDLGTGSLTATSLIKAGGTSSQFLKADGSVDSTAYLSTSTASTTYVPYTGATNDVNLGVYGITAQDETITGTNELCPDPTGTISITQVTDPTNSLGYAYQSYKYQYPYTSPTATYYYYNNHTYYAYTYITRGGVKYYSANYISQTFDDAQLDEYYLTITLPALPAGADGWAVFETIDQSQTSGKTTTIYKEANASTCGKYYPSGLTFNDGTAISGMFPTPWTIGAITMSAVMAVTYPLPIGYAPISNTITGSTNITNGSFYIGGDYGIYPSALGSAGTHFAWLPQYGALRIGSTSSDAFKESNIGLNSIGIGRDTVASNYRGIAIGLQCYATGADSVSLGNGNLASASNAVAIGSVNDATLTYDVAIGYNNNATGGYSVAIGAENTASAAKSIAIGWVNTASGTGSIALGVANITSGTYAFSTGYSITSVGQGSFAAGWNANPTDYTKFVAGAAGVVRGSIALGYASSGQSHRALTEGSVVIGQDLNATTNKNITCFGRSYTATTADTVNIGFGAIHYAFSSTALTIADSINIPVGSTNGTKIGTATTQKLGFFNATPVVQPLATTDLGTVLSNLGFRAAGTAYPITTSGAVTFTGSLSFTGSPVKYSYTGRTVATTLGNHYLMDGTSGTWDATLPTAAGVAGTTYVIKNSGTGVLTVKTTSSQTIDGIASGVITLSQGQYIKVMSDNANWKIMGGNVSSYGFKSYLGDTYFGDGGVTNYVKFDSTGHQTFAGTAQPWDDLRVEPNVKQAAGAGVPAFEKYFDDVAGTSKGVYLYSFTDEAVAGNEKEIFFTAQMPHSWNGGEIKIHVHFVPNATVATSDIVWGLEYAMKEPSATFGDTTIVYSSTTLVPDDADITAGKHYIATFSGITPDSTQDGLSTILICRLFRNSSNASDTYTNKVGLLYVDIHYQIARIGSTDEYTA